MVVEIAYFAGPGRAEVLKLIAEVGQVEYTFKGIPREEWPNHKVTCRYGQLPYLKINDETTLYQTTAIARYLAQEGGLYPTDRLEASATEEYVAAIDDIIAGFVRIFFRTPEEKREEELKAFSEGILKTTLVAFEKVLEKNEGNLVKGKLTWADLVLYDIVVNIQSKGADISYAQNVLKLKETVAAHERVKAFLESDRNLRKQQ